MAQIMFYSFANIFKLCWSTRRNEGNSRPSYNKTSNYVTSKWEVAWQCPTTSSPTTYSSEGDQMHPTQGRLTHLQWGGSRSPVTMTRPPIPPSNPTLPEMNIYNTNGRRDIFVHKKLKLQKFHQQDILLYANNHRRPLIRSLTQLGGGRGATKTYTFSRVAMQLID